MTQAKRAQYALGFDIGGTKIEGAVISSLGEVLRSRRVATPQTYLETRSCLLQLVQDLRGKEDLIGVGVGIPGSLDPKTKILRNAPNSPAINNSDFFKELEQALDLPLLCQNDANCLILSEVRFGAARGSKNAVGLILGSGVGSGVYLDGKLFQSTRGLAPEVGHSILDINGRRCLCGNTGCVEAYLSGNSILRRYHDAGGDFSITKTEDLFARSNDEIAKKILNETAYLYSRFIATIVSLYDPEIIVLGGGLSLQNLFYECDNQISQFIFGSRIPPQIVRAQNGDASGKLGAASLFFKE